MPDNKSDSKAVKKFFSEYINSKNYKKRLTKQGHTDPNSVIQDRLNNLKNTKEKVISGPGNQYLAEYNTVTLDPLESAKYNMPFQSIRPHEYSHAVGAMSSSAKGITNPNLKLNNQENKQFNSRSKFAKKDTSKMTIEEWSQNLHDRLPHEAKASMDALRFSLHRDGIYNTGTEEFNKEHLKKAKQKYSKDSNLNRNFKGFADDDLIYLMNNIASTSNNEDLLVAKNGGSISKQGYKKSSPFKNRKEININTPSGIITTEDMAFPILANGVPLYPNTGDYQFNTTQVKETPMKAKKGAKIKKYQSGGTAYDEYNQRLWGEGVFSPNQAPVNPAAITPTANPNYNSHQAPTTTKPTATVDTANLKDALATPTDRPDVKNKNGKSIGYKGPAIGLGPLLQGGIGLINKILGPEQGRRRIDNTLAYNPFPQGTGSQAIFQEGGLVKKNKASRKANKNLVPNNYGKYNGIVNEEGVHISVPTELQAIETMARYAQYNMPEQTSHPSLSPSNVYRPEFQHHSINVAPQVIPNDNPTYAKHGAKIEQYNNGGLQVHEGGSAPAVSYNPIDGGMGEFKGNSHADDGILSSYNGKAFEAEGGEPYRIDDEGALEIFGNLKNPLTGNKFKKDAKVIATKEKKVQRFLDKGVDIVTNTDSKNKFDKLKFNSGSVMLKGGLQKQKELADAKDQLSAVQEMMLQQEENTTMKNGGIMEYQDGGKPGNPKDEYLSYVKKYATKYGVNPTTIERIIQTESGFNPKAVSGAGAKGIMQFMPKTAKSYGLNDNSSVEDNIAAGVKHYASLLKQNRGDEKLAIAAYNMGQGNLNDFIKSSGKKASDYTGDDLIRRLEEKRKNNPSNKKNLAQNQTYNYLKNITGEVNEPEKFREEYYSFNGKQKLPPPERVPWDPNNPFVKQPPTPVTGLPPTPIPEFNFKNPETTPYVAPKRRKPWEQIAPAIPQVFDTPDFVERQGYQPELYTPYQVSFQDRINQNSRTFNALAPSLVGNAEAQGALAAQLYGANNAVQADEFRTNQGISNDITNKNVSIINDAKLKNLQLADTQYVRQAQARANTKDRRIGAGIQIGDIIAKNNLENKTLDVTSQLYKNYAYDKNMQLQYVGQETAGDRMNSGYEAVPSKTEVTTQANNTKTKKTYEAPDFNLGRPDILRGLRRKKNFWEMKDGGKLTHSKIRSLMYS